MPRDRFVDREDQLRRLEDALELAAIGQGRAIAVTGDPGMGKTQLVNALHEWMDGKASLKGGAWASATCHQHTGPQDAFRPFIDILRQLSASDRSKQRADFVKRLLKEAGPDWLGMIPVVGSAVAATAKVLASGTGPALTRALTDQYLAVVERLSEKHAPLVLEIEDAQWIDPASCDLLVELGRSAARLGLLPIVTYRPLMVGKQHPLRESLREMEIAGVLDAIELSGFEAPAVADYLVQRYGGVPHPSLAQWLRYVCGGHPLFVREYLTLLEDEGLIRRVDGTWRLLDDLEERGDGWVTGEQLERLGVPDTVEAVLELRMEGLQPPDQRTLRAGSVQGVWFSLGLLARTLEMPVEEVQSRLEELQESQQRILEWCDNDDWIVPPTEVWAFNHGLLQKVLYAQLLPNQRRRYHLVVAGVIEEIVTAQPVPARRLVLDLARHLEAARRPLDAARYFVVAADSTFYDGGFRESEELCQRALRNLDGLPDDAKHDGLRARALLRLLAATEPEWHGSEWQDDSGVGELAQRARAAAERSGEPGLIADARVLSARMLIAKGARLEGLEAMRDALAQIQELQDTERTLATLINLGYATNTVSLDEGVGYLREAESLAARRLGRTDELSVKRHRARLACFLGTAELDRGCFDAARELLERGVAELEQLGLRFDLPRMLNLYSQVHFLSGAFEAAKQVLTQAETLLSEELHADAELGYTHGLLGKLMLEWSRVADAEPALMLAEQKLAGTGRNQLHMIVRGYMIELRTAATSGCRDPARAIADGEALIRDAQERGFRNIAVMARALTAQAMTAAGDAEGALPLSTEAVVAVAQRRRLVLVREEEVHAIHASILTALSRGQEAARYWEQAHAIMIEKWQTLADADRRRDFLERIPVNRTIAQHGVNAAGS